MEKPIEVGHERTRSLVRDLVNKLAVIVGHCDLLSEHLKEGSQSAKHVGAIQEIPREMARDLNEYSADSQNRREAPELWNVMSRRSNESSNAGLRHGDSILPPANRLASGRANEHPCLILKSSRRNKS
jgi:hypothetical protein